MKRGTNLPGFVDVQLEFAAHIRNPDLHPAPGDIEPRRIAKMSHPPVILCSIRPSAQSLGDRLCSDVYHSVA